MATQVFFDPERKRWRRLRFILNVAGVLTTLLIVFFALSLYRQTSLPDLLLPGPKRPYRPIKETERRRYPRRPITRRKTTAAPSQVVLNSGEGIRAAFYVTWDAGSFASLKEYGHQIDLLFPEWLHVLTADGHLQAVNQDNVLFDVLKPAGQVTKFDERVMDLIKREKLPMDVFPLVNNFDPIANDWVSDIGGMLSAPAARAHFRQELMTFVASDGYKGLALDLEGFPFAAQPGYRALVAELCDDLHRRGLKLYISVPPRNEDFDYAFMAAHADGVVIMNYDQHFPGGPAGPVAALDWFVQNLERDLKLMPREKIICAIANYGYNFPQPKRGKPAPEVKGVSVQEAWLEAQESEAEVEFDDDSLTPHFAYMDEEDVRHDVWFLDAVTALNQMRAAQRLGINTFALWRLGGEDRSLWKVWDNPADAAG